MKTETWTIAAMPIDDFGKMMKRVLDEINNDHTSTVRDIKYDTILIGHEVHYSAIVIMDVTPYEYSIYDDVSPVGAIHPEDDL